MKGDNETNGNEVGGGTVGKKEVTDAVKPEKKAVEGQSEVVAVPGWRRTQCRFRCH